MINPQPAQEIDNLLRNALKWEQIFVTCLFCDGQFWATHNEYECPFCGKRGYTRDLPMVRLDGTVK